MTNTQLQQRPRSAVDARSLWTGGVATAVVAALVAVVGVLIVRGVFGLPVMAPGNAGYVGAVGLAVFAAVGGLLATALAHVLLLLAPRPMVFFGWIVGLVTLAFAIRPSTVSAGVAGHFANAVLYVVLGVAIGTLVGRTAGQAVRPR
ncbi:DUF6069 family protein [Amycolatopsis sp. NPDC051102]|uniref:DUF6069 family protein n=1 Tax=Amycolatopsis sp. NPDC051102 TaxID=3155163 RepID=UPI0034174A57